MGRYRWLDTDDSQILWRHFFILTDLHDLCELPISRWKWRILQKGDKFAPLIHTHVFKVTIMPVYVRLETVLFQIHPWEHSLLTFSLSLSRLRSCCPSMACVLNSGVYWSMFIPISQWHTCWDVQSETGRFCQWYSFPPEQGSSSSI